MITTRGLTKDFDSTRALVDLDLHVPAGSVFALLGPNGAGKTTAIKIILNIVRATRGRAEVLGCDSRKLGFQQLSRIGYVSENRELPDWMRVGSFLEYCRKLYPDWRDADALNLINSFGLPLNRTLRSLSRGIRMKVAFACALAYRPGLLILDEPFSGLDVSAREQLIQSIAEYTQDGTTLIATHDLAEIESFATHVGYICEGRLVFSEELEALRSRFREVEVVFENPQRENEWLPHPLPKEWLSVKHAAGTLRFTHARYDAQRCHSEVRQYWRGIRDVSIRPLPLRSIFVTLGEQQTSEVDACK